MVRWGGLSLSAQTARRRRIDLSGVQVLLEFPVEVLVRADIEELDHVAPAIELVGEEQLEAALHRELDDTNASERADLGLADQWVLDDRRDRAVEGPLGGVRQPALRLPDARRLFDGGLRGGSSGRDALALRTPSAHPCRP